MLGYLKDKEGTLQCMKGKWFYTGDVGFMHKDGYLEIKDRSKDVIIRGGENVSSLEVESVLYLHPAVKETAVVARPDEFWGEMPCAFVSLDCGKTATEKEMIDQFCREKLPRYMVPRKVVFKEDLPKMSTGKIQKFLLREMAKELVSSCSSGGGSKMLGSQSDWYGEQSRYASGTNVVKFPKGGYVYSFPFSDDSKSIAVWKSYNMILREHHWASYNMILREQHWCTSAPGTQNIWRLGKLD